MTKRRSTSFLLAIGVVLAFTAGCGVTSTSDASGTIGDATAATDATTTTDAATTTTQAPDATTEPDSQPDRTIGTVSIPPDMLEPVREQLELGFKAAGLTDDQARCLADAYIEDFGTDLGAAADTATMLDLFTTCDISPSDLGGKGGPGGG
ncbi:MAG: hypothetical protein JWM47_2603 [Acidimicrobiales bacterium]|nr:hypothetical protein [Acidimicrobiales bacterium]